MSLELECEVPERDEHRGKIKIVLDDEDNVLAMCAQCRSDAAYTRIIDDDPTESARADGGVDVTQWRDLTGFQQETLKAIARHDVQKEVPYGLNLKAELELRYGKEVNHGRLYPNLDDLVNKGFVEKGELDKRTNSYELSDQGRSLLELALAYDKALLEAMTDQPAGQPADTAVKGGDD
jgi:DNA-binding PadR family transcriptional regulator